MIDPVDINRWEEENQHKYHSMTWIKNCYWKLEKISCVLVLRNKQWFNDNISSLRNIWSIIEKERISGFEHRGPNKRIKQETNEINNNSGCLLTLNKEDNKISINGSDKINDLDFKKVIKINDLELNNNIELWKNIFKK
jgi:hypothetical protein